MFAATFANTCIDNLQIMISDTDRALTAHQAVAHPQRHEKLLKLRNSAVAYLRQQEFDVLDNGAVAIIGRMLQQLECELAEYNADPSAPLPTQQFIFHSRQLGLGLIVASAVVVMSFVYLLAK